MRRNNNRRNKKNNKRGKKIVLSRSLSEVKFTDNFVTAYSQSTTPVVHNCNAIAQGTSFNQRVGIWIDVKSITIRLDMFIGSALVGNASGHLRFVLVRDLQQVAGTAPTVTDVINPFTPLGVRNVYFMKRFQILEDFLVRFHTYDPVKRITRTVPVNDRAGYSGGASTDFAYRGIYLLLVTDNTANAPSIAATIRCNFTDP